MIKRFTDGKTSIYAAVFDMEHGFLNLRELFALRRIPLCIQYDNMDDSEILKDACAFMRKYGFLRVSTNKNSKAVLPVGNLVYFDSEDVLWHSNEKEFKDRYSNFKEKETIDLYSNGAYLPIDYYKIMVEYTDNSSLQNKKDESQDNPLSSQVGGNHYKNFAIQPVEFIAANKIGFIEGSVIEYVCRHEHKNGSQDIEKAIHFLQLLLQLKYKQEPVKTEKLEATLPEGYLNIP